MITLEISSGNLLTESFNQRMLEKEWKELLAEGKDGIVINGKPRRLIARRLCYGVVEVYIQPVSDVT